MKIGITGAAGFIGMHLTNSLMLKGHDVVGIDSLNPAYGGSLCSDRLRNLQMNHDFVFKNLDLSEAKHDELTKILQDCEVIIHLAAWPGVRQSQLMPSLYVKNNVNSFSNILGVVREIRPRHFMYASSSSIYGDLGIVGSVRESDATGLNLKSYYAATKWMNETEARSSQKLVNFPITALRFFTVYGPWGRPDMAYWSFLEKVKKNQEIDLYGETGGSRNFTYITDAIKILMNLIEIDLIAEHRELNIACGNPNDTIEFLRNIADAAGKEPLIRVVERPAVDVERTWANLQKISNLISLPEPTPMPMGIRNFITWYESYQQ